MDCRIHATAYRLATTVCRTRRRFAASCDGSSYAYDVSSQVATARRTWTMSRRKLRRLVVRGRCLVASCGSSSYMDDGPSQVSASTQTQTLSALLFLYRTVLEREVQPPYKNISAPSSYSLGSSASKRHR